MVLAFARSSTGEPRKKRPNSCFYALFGRIRYTVYDAVAMRQTSGLSKKMQCDQGYRSYAAKTDLVNALQIFLEYILYIISSIFFCFSMENYLQII